MLVLLASAVRTALVAADLRNGDRHPTPESGGASVSTSVALKEQPENGWVPEGWTLSSSLDPEQLGAVCL